jgi:hypothetical protein
MPFRKRCVVIVNRFITPGDTSNVTRCPNGQPGERGRRGDRFDEFDARFIEKTFASSSVPV